MAFSSRTRSVSAADIHGGDLQRLFRRQLEMPCIAQHIAVLFLSGGQSDPDPMPRVAQQQVVITAREILNAQQAVLDRDRVEAVLHEGATPQFQQRQFLRRDLWRWFPCRAIPVVWPATPCSVAG